MKFAKTKFYCFSLLTVFCLLVVTPAFSAPDETISFLCKQLENINRFDKSQEKDANGSSAISNFVKSQKGASGEEGFSPESIAAIEAFIRFVFSNDEAAGKSLRALQFAGQLELQKAKISRRQPGPFAGHVIEAIEVNQARAKFYAQASKGQSESLSKLYTNLEKTILPLAKIFDRWAARLWQKGLPVMKNDFVSMAGLPTPDACPVRMGRMNDQGIKDYRSLLKTFRRNSYKAAWHYDFVALQIHAISALHQLKALQEIHHCNLTLSIHLIESIGLAARNADQIKQQFKNSKAASSFYRAFIISQILGTRMFANIDLKAQFFHQAGIGIITNDLPRIPFPAKQ